MTLGTTHSTVSYTGDGTTVKFNVTFEFHAATDIEVIVVTIATGAESRKSLGTDYTVGGGDGSVGQVTLNVAPPTTERVVIRRVSPAVQPDDLINGGPLDADALERRLDIITARLQELETDNVRSIRVAKGSQAPDSGLTLNLIGGKGKSLAVSNDELGIIIAAAVAPDDAVLSPKGEELVGLPDEAAMRTFLELTAAATTDIGTSGATIPLLNGNNTHAGTNAFDGDATFNSDATFGAPIVIGREALTIDASGGVAPTKSRLVIDTFGAAATDDLDTISVANHPVGSVIEIQAGTSGQVPTVRHFGGGSGNIFLDQDVDTALDDLDKVIWLQRRDASDGEHNDGWYEVGRSFPIWKPWDTIQAVSIETNTEFATTNTTPNDTTTPQSSESDVIQSLAFKPQFAGSKIRVKWHCPMLSAAASRVVFIGLFKDGDTTPLRGWNEFINGANWTRTVDLEALVDATNTNVRTYKIQVGGESPNVYVNRTNTANFYGGNALFYSRLTIEEIAQ